MLYCKTHYFKKFHEEGSYLGGDKYENKNPRDSKGGGIALPSNSTTEITTAPTVTAASAASTSSSLPATTSTVGRPPLPPKLDWEEIMNADADSHPIITEDGVPLTRQLTPAVEASENLNFGPELDTQTQPMIGLARQITPTFAG